MNARTAQLLRKFARQNNRNLKDVKRVWNSTPRNKRSTARDFLVQDLIGL